VSAARVVNGDLWLASYQGERIAVRAVPTQPTESE